MDKNLKDNSNQENDSMSKEKTNQDYNKEQPNPNDPSQENKIKIGEEPENKKREITANTTENTKDTHGSGDGNQDTTGEETNNNPYTQKGEEKFNSIRNENRTERPVFKKGRL